MSVEINQLSKLEQINLLERECEILFKSVPDAFREDFKQYQNIKKDAIKLLEQLKKEALIEFKEKWNL